MRIKMNTSSPRRCRRVHNAYFCFYVFLDNSLRTKTDFVLTGGGDILSDEARIGFLSRRQPNEEQAQRRNENISPNCCQGKHENWNTRVLHFGRRQERRKKQESPTIFLPFYFAREKMFR